jgi:GNAT superfamily N-acetyltransferase
VHERFSPSVLRVGDTRGIVGGSGCPLEDAQQRGGLGTALMAHAIKELSPASEVKLLVNQGNTSAIEYYKHKGFLIDGETHVKMGDFEFNDYIFSRPLTPA